MRRADGGLFLLTVGGRFRSDHRMFPGTDHDLGNGRHGDGWFRENDGGNLGDQRPIPSHKGQVRVHNAFKTIHHHNDYRVLAIQSGYGAHPLP